jgi:hypothetical protein
LLGHFFFDLRAATLSDPSSGIGDEKNLASGMWVSDGIRRTDIIRLKDGVFPPEGQQFRTMDHHGSRIGISHERRSLLD